MTKRPLQALCQQIIETATVLALRVICVLRVDKASACGGSAPLRRHYVPDFAGPSPDRYMVKYCGLMQIAGASPLRPMPVWVVDRAPWAAGAVRPCMSCSVILHRSLHVVFWLMQRVLGHQSSAGQTRQSMMLRHTIIESTSLDLCARLSTGINVTAAWFLQRLSPVRGSMSSTSPVGS